jgi:hypothetical protein
VSDAKRWLGALAVPVLLLAGCSEDEDGPLAVDQLPREVVESGSHTSGTPTATSCPDLNQAQQHVAVSAASESDDNFRSWTYRLDDGTWIAVSVAEIGSPVVDQDQALAEITTAIDSCADQEDAGDVAHLDSAPEGSVGYRSTMTDSNGTREGETVVAAAGDRIVLVTATHDEGSDPSVDVRDLLADVQDRAADIDLG